MTGGTSVVRSGRNVARFQVPPKQQRTARQFDWSLGKGRVSLVTIRAGDYLRSTALEVMGFGTTLGFGKKKENGEGASAYPGAPTTC